MPDTESLSAGLNQAFIQLITKSTGLEIRKRDQASLDEKIFLRMKALKLNLPENYYQLLASSNTNSHEEWQNLVTLLTNTDSFFFRDKEQFNLLQNHILPDIIKRKTSKKNIRICSAGCSSGEEPYSLAILLMELIPDLEHWNGIILGIDINQIALQKAKTGIYSPWSFRSVGSELKQRYFHLINNQYHLNQKIKQMPKFQSLNLVKDPFPHQNSELRDMDLILCRNVFIYFEAAAIAKVLDKFYQTLQPLGYLITGHAELSGQDLSQFQTKVFPESLVYQRQADGLVNTPPVFSQSGATAPPVEDLLLDANHSTLESTLEKNNIKMQQTALSLLKQLPPNTKILKLGNLTAAELILQLETELKATENKTI